MKLIIWTCVLAIASALYTDIDDKMDIVALDNNDEDLKKFFDCYLDKGPCTDTMMSFKKHFKQAFHDKCANCTPAEKHIGEEFLKTSLAKFPDLVKQLQQKYDPQGKDFQSLLGELAKYDY